MGLMAIYPTQKLSIGNKAHTIYPYLLRGLKIERLNQVWQTDITYIPMKKGFMYMMAVIDVKSRYILHWSLSNTMDASWCTQVLQQTIKRHGAPEIFNTDQDSQFTSNEFLEVLKGHHIQISMDGKGRALDNIYILSKLFQYPNFRFNSRIINALPTKSWDNISVNCVYKLDIISYGHIKS